VNQTARRRPTTCRRIARRYSSSREYRTGDHAPLGRQPFRTQASGEPRLHWSLRHRLCGRQVTDTLPRVSYDRSAAPATTPDDRLALALDATGDLIAAVGGDQWSDPTPCPPCSVRSLVNHLVFGNHRFAGILSGEQPPSLERLRQSRDINRLGDDPAGACREAGDALPASFSKPNVLERVFESPIGFVPGLVLLPAPAHHRNTRPRLGSEPRYRKTRQTARRPRRGRTCILPESTPADVPRTGRFGPAPPVADDAPAIDRLAAFLGRPIETSSGRAERA
jgi:hypothetical protein